MIHTECAITYDSLANLNLKMMSGMRKPIKINKRRSYSIDEIRKWRNWKIANCKRLVFSTIHGPREPFSKKMYFWIENLQFLTRRCENRSENLEIIFFIHQWAFIILYIKEYIIFVYFSSKLSSITIIRVQKIPPGFSYQKSLDSQLGPTFRSDRIMIYHWTDWLNFVIIGQFWPVFEILCRLMVFKVFVEREKWFFQLT